MTANIARRTMIIDHRWSDHKRSNNASQRSLIQRPVSRGIVSPRQKPNPDWGTAWGAGRTNNPSLYNVKYHAHRSSSSRTNGKSVLIVTRSAKPGSEHHLPNANGGARRDRTDDLLNANQALSQLSYGPKSWENGGHGWTRTTDLTLIR